MEEFNILVSAAGRRVVLIELFRQALQRLGLSGKVMATDRTKVSPAFQSADKAFQVPAAADPKFVPTVLEICKKQQIKLIIPTNDHELPSYAAHQKSFAEAGTTVAISTPEVIDICRDKVRTHQWLIENDFPTVDQSAVKSFDRLLQQASFPFLVKPRWGSAAIGVQVVEDHQALEIATRQGEFVVQTLAKGKEHTVDLLLDRQGKCHCAVPRKRIEVRGGEVSKGMTVRAPLLERLAWQIGETLPGAYGTINVQIFYQPQTEEMAVIEINPRYGGGYPLSWQAGACYPVWMIEELLNRTSTANAHGWQDQLVMLRYDEAIFVDAAGLDC